MQGNKRPLLLWISKINVIKMSIQLQASYRFHAIHIKTPVQLFTEIGKNIKIHIEAQKTPDNPSNPEQ